DIAAGTAVATEQQGEVTLAPKLSLEDARLDWTLPSAVIDARRRGVTPEPGATTTLDDERFKVLDATIAHGAARLDPGVVALRGREVHVGTADDPLVLLTVQPAGKRAMPAADWWRGRPADTPTVLR